MGTKLHRMATELIDYQEAVAKQQTVYQEAQQAFEAARITLSAIPTTTTSPAPAAAHHISDDAWKAKLTQHMGSILTREMAAATATQIQDGILQFFADPSNFVSAPPSAAPLPPPDTAPHQHQQLHEPPPSERASPPTEGMRGEQKRDTPEFDQDDLFDDEDPAAEDKRRRITRKSGQSVSGATVAGSDAIQSATALAVAIKQMGAAAQSQSSASASGVASQCS